LAEKTLQVPTPLFERLVDWQPWESREVRPQRTLDRHGLRESVRRELERLLRCRSTVPAHLIREHELSVLDYGLPDLAAYSARNQDHWPLIARAVEAVIEAYEPRLRNPRVEVVAADERWTLKVVVHGTLATDDLQEPVSFPTVIQGPATEVKADGVG
jgi:type VI secretion system lysozyme-like protein